MSRQDLLKFSAFHPGHYNAGWHGDFSFFTKEQLLIQKVIALN